MIKARRSCPGIHFKIAIVPAIDTCGHRPLLVTLHIYYTCAVYYTSGIKFILQRFPVQTNPLRFLCFYSRPKADRGAEQLPALPSARAAGSRTVSDRRGLVAIMINCTR